MTAELFPRVVLFGASIVQESEVVHRALTTNESFDKQSFSKGGWGASIADHFQRKCDVLNRGFSGYTSAFGKVILPRILQCDNTPKGSIVAAVVLIGTNDSVIQDLDPRGTTVDQYATNMTDILSLFLNDGIPPSHIVVLTPPAVSEEMWETFCKENDRVMSLSDDRVKCFATRCAEVGKKLGVNVVDLYTLFHEQPANWESFLSDGIHLSKEGSHFVAEHVIQLLETKLGNLPLIYPDWKNVDPKHPEKSLCNEGNS